MGTLDKIKIKPDKKMHERPPYTRANDKVNSFRKKYGLHEVRLEKKHCLKCDDIFISEGPQNRLCDKCRTRGRKGTLEKEII